MEHTADREEYGGVKVYWCPKCDHEKAYKSYPYQMAWSPPMLEGDYQSVMIERVDDDRRPYRVDTPPGRGSRIECMERQQAEDLAAVAVLTGFVEEESGSRGVPPNVAAAGMPEIVTYLLAHPESNVHENGMLGEAWELEDEAIESYRSDVRSRAEKFR